MDCGGSGRGAAGERVGGGLRMGSPRIALGTSDRQAEGLMKRYGKPTWITEFAINKWARVQHGGCDNCNITRPMQ